MPVLAVNDSTATAIPLDASHSTASDQLTGNSGGAFRYYSFVYPGAGVPVPITMQAQPGHGTTGVAAGFNVYGPGGFSIPAIASDQSTTSSSYGATVSSATAGTYFIQVFNYIQGLPLSFQLAVNGLQATPTPGAGSSPSQPIVLQQTSVTTGGQLTGSTSGAFTFYLVNYPGAQTPMTITVGYSPITSTSDKAVGCNLYRNEPTSPSTSTLVGQCAESGRNATSATTTFTLRADGAAPYLLQVNNYLAGITIDFTLIVTGMTGPMAQVSTNTTSESAFVLSPASPAAQGQLVGNSQGGFNYFVMQYPGGNANVLITLTSPPNSQIGDGTFGFNLYVGSNHVGQSNAGLDALGERTTTFALTQSDAQTFGIQVFNYANATASYVITVQGL
jgi:hypothetical protein